MLKAARLVCNGQDEFCLIRQVGRGWLLAEVYCTIPTGEQVAIILTDELVLPGIARWVGGSRAQVLFDEDVDVEAILAGGRVARDGQQLRMPRANVDAWARLRVGSRLFSIRLGNISQGGAKIEVHGLLKSGQDAVLTIRGLPPLPGVIRWHSEDEAGISFNQPLGFAELAMWLARHRRGCGQDSFPAGSGLSTITELRSDAVQAQWQAQA